MYNKEDAVNSVVEHFKGSCMVHPDLLNILYDIAYNCKEGVVVEIGSNAGCSTCTFAKGIRDSGTGTTFYSIDPHNGGGETPIKDSRIDKKASELDFRELSPDYKDQGVSHIVWAANVSALGLEDYVTPIILYSEEAYAYLKEQGKLPHIGMLFIDADHRYYFVKKDADLWLPHVITGGTVIFDDSSYPGVKRVIDELIAARRIIPVDNSMAIFKKA